MSGVSLTRLLVVLALICIPAMSASAHTTDELDVWQDAWIMEYVSVGPYVSPSLLAEMEDMQTRHPWYWGIEVRSEELALHQGMGTNVEQWRGLVTAHFAPADVETALCLIAHESGGNPEAKNPISSARGLFQILASLWAPIFGVSYSNLYVPEINTRIARQVYDRQGWEAWSPYLRGECRGL